MSVTAPSRESAIGSARRGGETVARSRSFEWLARAGFVARGLIYALIGVLALKLALGSSSAPPSQNGALETIAKQPFGKILLILVAVGVAGYALWRLIHALVGHGPERADSGFERVTALASGVAYAGICAIAIEILLGSGGNSHSPQQATGGVLAWPAGTALVATAGAVMIGAGVYQGYRGISHDFLKDSKTEQMSGTVRNWIEWIGTFGHLARMTVFGLVGAFLIKAAVDYNPNNAVGVDGALQKLAQSPYGPFLLGVVAAGLVAFGTYSLSDARYRRI
jgi:fumarate reductase subunit D